MTRLHTRPLPTTYTRGHRCLDYVFATEHVVSAIIKAGFEPFNIRYPTDHRSYFVDLSITGLFGVQIQPLATYEPRVLESTNVNQVTAYIEKKYELLLNHNVFERIQRLSQPWNRHRFAERLDRDITEASIAAENKLTRYREPQWSVTLAKSRKQAQVITMKISMIKTRIDNKSVIRAEWLSAGLEGFPPNSLRQCTEMLRNKKKEIEQIVKESFSNENKKGNVRSNLLKYRLNRAISSQPKD